MYKEADGDWRPRYYSSKGRFKSPNSLEAMKRLKDIAQENNKRSRIEQIDPFTLNVWSGRTLTRQYRIVFDAI